MSGVRCFCPVVARPILLHTSIPLPHVLLHPPLIHLQRVCLSVCLLVRKICSINGINNKMRVTSYLCIIYLFPLFVMYLMMLVPPQTVKRLQLFCNDTVLRHLLICITHCTNLARSCSPSFQSSSSSLLYCANGCRQTQLIFLSQSDTQDPSQD